MPTQAQTDAFLESLPRLSLKSRLAFACHSEIPCFNRCCGDLNLALSPYDVLRLRFALGIDSKTFLRKYGELSALHGNQFPSIMLKMSEDAEHSCPFVRETGCSVYAHRPGACRVYPLGRGASVDEQGELHEEYILVQESHCLGFETQKEISVEAYLMSQEMPPYIDFDNQYIQLMHRWNRKGAPLPKSLFGMVFTAVYRPDALQITTDNTNAAHVSKTQYNTLAEHEALLKDSFAWLAKKIN